MQFKLAVCIIVSKSTNVFLQATSFTYSKRFNWVSTYNLFLICQQECLYFTICPLAGVRNHYYYYYYYYLDISPELLMQSYLHKCTHNHPGWHWRTLGRGDPQNLCAWSRIGCCKVYMKKNVGSLHHTMQTLRKGDFKCRCKGVKVPLEL